MFQLTKDEIGLMAGERELRPEVLAFAQRMERKLREHDAERGDSWKGEGADWLIERLEEEVTELRMAGTVDAQLSEAADVGSFAMMIAHVVETMAGEPPAKVDAEDRHVAPSKLIDEIARLRAERDRVAEAWRQVAAQMDAPSANAQNSWTVPGQAWIELWRIMQGEGEESGYGG